MSWRSARTFPTACSPSRPSRAERGAAPLTLAAALLLAAVAQPARPQALETNGEARIAAEVDVTDDPAASRASELLYTAWLSARHTLPFQGGSLVVRHRLSAQEIYDQAPADEITYALYEAFARLDLSPELDLTVGRAFLPWGAGLSFHPADALNPVTQGSSGVFRPEESGFTGASITWSSTVTASAAASIDRALSQESDWWRGVRSAARLSTLAGTLAAGVSTVYQPGDTSRLGAHASVEVLGNVLGAEAAADLQDGPVFAATAHLLRVLPLGSLSATVVLEWYDQDSRRFAEGFPNGQVLAPALTISEGDAVDFENAVFVALDDGSVLARHGLTVALGPQDELRVVGSWTAGARDTAFGSLPQRFAGEVSLLVAF